jgi:ankyrin repeat protein
LLLAATADHAAVARLLVDLGADPDALDGRHDSAWLVTGVTGSVEMARIIAAAKPDYGLLNRFGGTSLIPASERGHADYVAWVVEHTPMKIDHVNDLGWTALLEAVILGEGSTRWQRIVRTLIDAGADASIADKDGVTPLQHARNRGHTEVARIIQGERA